MKRSVAYWMFLLGLSLSCGGGDDPAVDPNDDDSGSPCELAAEECGAWEELDPEACVCRTVDPETLVGRAFSYDCFMDGDIAGPPEFGPAIRSFIDCADLPPLGIQVVEADYESITVQFAVLDEGLRETDNPTMRTLHTGTLEYPFFEIALEEPLTFETEGGNYRFSEIRLGGRFLPTANGIKGWWEGRLFASNIYLDREPICSEFPEECESTFTLLLRSENLHVPEIPAFVLPSFPVDPNELIGRASVIECFFDGDIVEPPGLGPVLKGLVRCEDLPSLAIQVIEANASSIAIRFDLLDPNLGLSNSSESVVLADVHFANPFFSFEFQRGLSFHIERVQLEFVDFAFGGRFLKGGGFDQGWFEGRLDPGPLEEPMGSIGGCGLIPGLCGPEGYIPLRVENLVGIDVPGLEISPPVCPLRLSGCPEGETIALSHTPECRCAEIFPQPQCPTDAQPNANPLDLVGKRYVIEGYAQADWIHPSPNDGPVGGDLMNLLTGSMPTLGLEIQELAGETVWLGFVDLDPVERTADRLPSQFAYEWSNPCLAPVDPNEGFWTRGGGYLFNDLSIIGTVSPDGTAIEAVTLSANLGRDCDWCSGWGVNCAPGLFCDEAPRPVIRIEGLRAVEERWEMGPPVCGDGVVWGDEVCEPRDGPCCDENCNLKPAGTPCGDQWPDWECDLPDACDGIDAACPDRFIPQYQSCGDGLFCNGEEICLGTRCLSETTPCQGDGLVCDEANDRCCPEGEACDQ